jgi:hypothetical protein
VADLGGMVVDRPKANRDALTACAALGGFFVVLALGTYLYNLDWRGAIPRDGSTLVVGRDFLNMWMYGRAAALPDPGQWYDPQVYARALAAIVGDNYPGQNWSYPPSIMLLAAPFGAFGYLPALLCWTVLGLAVFAPVAWRYLGDRRALIAVLCSPAAVFTLISGQLSFLATAALLGAFAWLERRPVAAGVLIGCLTVKPHLGILIPIMLVASRRWRVFAAASVTALALAALSVALFGVTPWIDYINIGLPVQNMVLADAGGIATPFYPTVFMNLRGIGVGYGAAMAVQAALALGAAALIVWAFRARATADPNLLSALFFACSVSALPYMLAYDTLPLCVATMALLATGTLDARGRLLARLVFWLPIIQIGLGTLHIPGPALIAPAFALYLFQHLRHARAPRPHAVLHAA